MISCARAENGQPWFNFACLFCDSLPPPDLGHSESKEDEVQSHVKARVSGERDNWLGELVKGFCD